MVLCLVAKRAGHAAAGRVQLGDAVARRQGQHAHCGRGATERLLVAVAVEQHLAGRIVESQLHWPARRGIDHELLEGESVARHHGAAAVVGQQRGIVVHHGRPIARLQENQGRAHARVALQRGQRPVRLRPRQAEHPLRERWAAHVGHTGQEHAEACRGEHFRRGLSHLGISVGVVGVHAKHHGRRGAVG